MKLIITLKFMLICLVAGAQDKEIRVDNQEGEWVPLKAMDNGDGTFSLQVVALQEPVNSDEVTITQDSDSSLPTLISDVNTYLAGSGDKLLSVTIFAWGTVTPTFYAIIVEKSP